MDRNDRRNSRYTALNTRCTASEGGWTILEGALVVGLLMVLITVAIGLVQYLNVCRFAEQALDQAIYDTAVKPFSMSGAEGIVEVAVERSRLDSAIAEFTQQISDSVDTYLQERELNTRARFSVESGYAEVRVDPRSGVAQSSGGFERTSPYGDLGLFSELQRERALERELEARVTRAVGAESQGLPAPSILAVPTASFHTRLPESSTRFLPFSVLIGGRVAISLRDTYIGSLLGVVGVEPAVYYQKLVPLRGEIAQR